MAEEHQLGGSEAFQERYSRQILFGPIGPLGQQRLFDAHVAIIGCGALGSTQASLLARAGVGTLSLIDRDYVEASNLQRQLLFDEEDAEESRPKASAAAAHLSRANSAIQIRPMVADLTSENVDELLEGAQILLDGTDNFETRYLLNDYAIAHAVPWIYGAAVGSYGATFTVLPGNTACLECAYGSQPTGAVETCDTAGVLNWATTLIAALQVAECVKWITGAHGALRESLLAVDVWKSEFREIQRPLRNPHCRACGQRDFTYLRGERRPHITLCGRDSVQIHERARPLDFRELQARLAPHGRVRYNELVFKFWTNAGNHANGPLEMTVFPDGRAIVKGTTDVTVARSLYARFIGS
jgi:adenylyltransferase/sulfurtransferase